MVLSFFTISLDRCGSLWQAYGGQLGGFSVLIQLVCPKALGQGNSLLTTLCQFYSWYPFSLELNGIQLCALTIYERQSRNFSKSRALTFLACIGMVAPGNFSHLASRPFFLSVAVTL